MSLKGTDISPCNVRPDLAPLLTKVGCRCFTDGVVLSITHRELSRNHARLIPDRENHPVTGSRCHPSFVRRGAFLGSIPLDDLPLVGGYVVELVDEVVDLVVEVFAEPFVKCTVGIGAGGT